MRGKSGKIDRNAGNQNVCKPAKNIPIFDQNLMISTVQDVTEPKQAEGEIKRLFMSGYTADVIAHHGVLGTGSGCGN